MTIPATVLAKMATIGLSSEQAEAVASMLAAVEGATAAQYEAAAEVSKAKARARVQKWRDRNVTERNTTSRNGLRAGDARVEDKTSNSKIEPQKENKSAQSARVSDLDDFRAALDGLADPERIESYVKHRRTKRGQITGHAARLFLADAEACALSPSEAIDACISRNWITVKPEYGIGKGRARGSPGSSAPSMAEVFELVGKRQSDERKSEDFSGTGAVVPYLPAFGQGRQ